MKKTTFLKTLLMAVGLCVGTNVFGQIVNWSANTTAGTAYSGGSEQSSNTSVVSIILGASGENWASRYNSRTFAGVQCNANASEVTLTGGIPTSGTFIKVIPAKDIKLTGTDYSYQICNHYMVCVDDESNVTQTSHAREAAASPDYGKLLAGNTYYLYFGSFKKSTDQYGFKTLTATSYETYTIHYQDENGTTIKDDVVYQGLYGATVTASESDMASVEYNDKVYYYQSGNEEITLGTSTNEITLVYASQTAATITVKYWNDAEPAVEIKDATSIDTYVGATDISASGDNLPTYITYSDVKYKYSSGNNAIATVTGDATINLVYTEADTYSYTIKSSTGATISSGSDYENETVDYTYPRYVLNGTTLYQSHAQGTPFSGSFTLTENNQEVTITYSATAHTNVYTYIEGEDISGATVNTSASNVDIRASYAAVGDGTNVKILTLPVGSYKFTIGQFMSRSNYDGTVTLNFGDQSFSYTATTVNLTESTSAESYTISSPTDLTFSVADNGHLDYLIIEQTGVTKTITSAGWATYCSPYALDFSSSIDNLTKAYLVTGATGNTLNLAEITGTVPENTGILLEGEGPVTIPVVASSSTDVSANKLVGKTAEYNLAAEGGYVLMGSPRVGFYKNNNAFTVGANTAYLPSNFAGGSARSFFSFDDDATGVQNLTPALSEGEGVVYNLRGQRVAQPTKGLYIVNGKKVVIK